MLDPAAELPSATPCAASTTAEVASPDIKLDVVPNPNSETVTLVTLAENNNGVPSNPVKPEDVKVGQDLMFVVAGEPPGAKIAWKNPTDTGTFIGEFTPLLGHHQSGFPPPPTGYQSRY